MPMRRVVDAKVDVQDALGRSGVLTTVGKESAYRDIKSLLRAFAPPMESDSHTSVNR